MNFSEIEQSSHTFVNEEFKNNEINSYYNEFSNNSNEILLSKEHIETYEFSNQPTSNQKNSKNKSGNDVVRKYLAGIVASLTMGTMIVAPAITTIAVEQPSLVAEISNENISFNSFECFLDVESTDESLTDATITNSNGDIHTISIQKQNETYRLYFDELIPETEYNLSVFDNEGTEFYVDKFTTDSFITIEEPINNQRKVSLHKDISNNPNNSEYILKLLSADGRDFSSNIISNYQSEIYNEYIQLDGLYLDEYILQLELYPQRTSETDMIDWENEPIVYNKQISLGDLEKLNFSVEIKQDIVPTNASMQIYLTYLSGDFDAYNITEIFVTHKTNEQSYFYAQFEIEENNNISIFLTELIESGEYNISVYGIFEGEDFSLYNEIWRGNLTVPKVSNI